MEISSDKVLLYDIIMERNQRDATNYPLYYLF